MGFQRTHEEKLFDRQTRLWGTRGQAALEQAHVLVLGSGPVATELLKNLLLANVKHFAVLDDQVVTESDTGNNFFIPPGSIGRLRAQVVVEQLCELNPRATGLHIVQTPASACANPPRFFHSYTLVVGTQLDDSCTLSLSSILSKEDIGYVNLTLNGFIGHARLCSPSEHCIIESHPESPVYDLCIHPSQLSRFPELSEFLHSFSLETGDVSDYSHVPCIAILVQMLERFGSVPATYGEKQAFKQSIAGEELNYSEARAMAYHIYTDPMSRVTSKDLLEYPCTATTPFYACLEALQQFYQTTGMLPVSSDIPDMTTFPQHYAKLKRIYADREQRDFAQFSSYVDTLIMPSMVHVTLSQLTLYR